MTDYIGGISGSGASGMQGTDPYAGLQLQILTTETQQMLSGPKSTLSIKEQDIVLKALQSWRQEIRQGATEDQNRREYEKHLPRAFSNIKLHLEKLYLEESQIDQIVNDLRVKSY
jgi:hypothetical protein